MTTDTENTLKVAQEGFNQLQYGLETGEWQGFLDMLTEDFSFWFPMGQYQGLNQGKERAAEFFAYVSASFGAGLKITSLDSVTSNATTVVFEFKDEGLWLGQPYKNRVAISLDIQGDKICRYREYFGSDGKSN